MISPQPAGGRPRPAEVLAIAAHGDAVVRNLRITECYYRLSSALREYLDGGANWCTFATWASRQAGCTIRGEDLADRLAEATRKPAKRLAPLNMLWRWLLRRGMFHPETRLGRVVRAIHSPFDAFERASDAVAAGNRRVFEEIAYEMARYMEECGEDAPAGSAGFERFLGGLRAGPPPGGQELLRRAFAHYHAARTETRPARRAQLMLLANLEIGFHEQTRLQPEIQRAMEAGPDTAEDLKARLIRLLPAGRLAGLPAAAWMPAARRYREFAREATRRAVTGMMMVLRVPGGTLALGRTLEAETPEIFAVLDEPELLALIRPFEPEGGCGGCGVEDWADLDQRMHYIFHLFRGYHATEGMFGEPFSPAASEAIRRGRLPDGEL